MMLFPIANRVLYKKNPLKQVICQIRFPAILRIESETPFLFQEKIRDLFPLFREEIQTGLEIRQSDQDGGIPQDILKEIAISSNKKNYVFSSEDELWTVNLTRSFIAVTANRYHRWEEFKSRLEFPLKALCDIYTPPYCVRVGLRYINIIDRTELNLGKISWNELIQPYVLGMINESQLKNHILSFQTQHEIKLSHTESKVRITTKLVQHVNTQEDCFYIDNDFFNEGRSTSNEVMSKLDYFNTQSSQLFQWMITEKLSKAMEPEAL